MCALCRDQSAGATSALRTRTLYRPLANVQESKQDGKQTEPVRALRRNGACSIRTFVFLFMIERRFLIRE